MTAVEIPVPIWWPDVDPLDMTVAIIATEPPLIYDDIAATTPLEAPCTPWFSSQPPSPPPSQQQPSTSPNATPQT